MNNIFQKNINALAQKNETLARELLTYIPTDVPELKQENGAYNLFYKNQYLHNPINPLGEAQGIFAMAENSPVAIHLVYGLGLGYLFQVASLNSQGAVILYEPDLNIMKIAFTLVDFSNDILKKNVYITNNLEQVSEYIYPKSNTKNSPLLLSTTSYRELNRENFASLVNELQQMIGRFGLDLKYTKERFWGLTKNLIKNLPNLVHETPIAEFQNRFAGQTAVVVSAGPSLDRNIETIKKYRDNIVLIVVGTAIKTLYKHGIKPDFLCLIEAYDSSKQIQGLDLSDIYFVTEPTANNSLRQFKYKDTFSHIAKNLPINNWWSKLANIDIEEYSSKGTVSYTALNCARILGCSRIIIVGQDLAYVEGQCYSKDSAYKDLVCQYNNETKKWEITAKDFASFCNSLSNSQNEEVRIKTAQKRLENLNASLYYVKGINGDMIPTESVYATFIKPLTEFTEIYNDRKYINASMIGAQIDGFENLTLEEALNDTQKIEDRELKNEFKYDISTIIEHLRTVKDGLKTAIDNLQEGQRLTKSLNNDLVRARNINPEILKLLKKISVNYLDLSTNFANQNPLFDFITTSERIDLDYEMKMMREFTFESVSKINEKLGTYYINAQKRVEYIDKMLTTAIEEIK